MSYFVRSLLILAFVAFASVTTASAQSLGVSPTDAATPPGLAKGTHPLGSYGGSGFDQVNLFNGNVSMSFPLAGSSGRAGMGAGVVLSYNSKFWRLLVDHPTPSATEVYPEYNEWDGGTYIGPGWRIHSGRLYARHSGYQSTGTPTGGCSAYQYIDERVNS